MGLGLEEVPFASDAENEIDLGFKIIREKQRNSLSCQFERGVTIIHLIPPKVEKITQVSNFSGQMVGHV